MTIGLTFIIFAMLLAVGCFVYAGRERSEGPAWLGIFLIVAAGLSIGIRSDSLSRKDMAEFCIKEGKNVTQIFNRKVCVLE